MRIMRKLFTLAIFFMLLSVTGMSQTSTLPNGNLNDWHFEVHQSPGGGYWVPDGDFFKTINILDTIATPSGITCFRSDTVHSGTHAARLVTREIAILQILIPGVVGTLALDMANITAHVGTPYTFPAKAASFQGWYRSAPVLGDSAGAAVLLSKWNTTTLKRDTLGFKLLVFKGNVSNYTFFDTPIPYTGPNIMPDSITMLLLASAGYNGNNFFACKGRVGSQAWFDDVTLTDVNGFKHNLMPEVSVKLFPNPASSKLIVELEKPIKNGKFMIYTLDGKEVYTASLPQVRNDVSVSALIAGTYYYKVSDGKSILNSGSFIVTK
jgi:hypothetical protein